ncbi:hypothetical protein A374_02929 [Fictibacillus macauensis ZFHKF-1]|uniref:Lipoprotein n=1 Tax=Fictibacillus macauensis ZFHKF-1 TaxID=1196324 RepID=I8UK18_9BACL|nr:YhcN/YlaJ family sporulation lipoprotein [Fictibacillus macauensis]EIT87173.1 hypothetical protein A374_02929 [Fictibacillus macauensis ZFHKF-1]
MNKKILLTASCAIALLLGGCNRDASQKEEKGYRFSNVSYKNGTPQNKLSPDGMDGHFGFVRHEYKGDNKKPLPSHKLATINRQRLAEIIADNAIRYPNVLDVAVFVTDEEVFMAYKTSNKNRVYMADNVKKAAFSVVPRYYHVYVSDQPGMIGKLGQYKSIQNHTENVDGAIGRLISQMKKAPQGHDVSPGENPNGETKGEKTNEQMMK